MPCGYLPGLAPAVTVANNTVPLVLEPGKGECADPVGRDAIVGAGGPGPPVGAGERQLSPDRGGEET